MNRTFTALFPVGDLSPDKNYIRMRTVLSERRSAFIDQSRNNLFRLLQIAHSKPASKLSSVYVLSSTFNYIPDRGTGTTRKCFTTKLFDVLNYRVLLLCPNFPIPIAVLLLCFVFAPKAFANDKLNEDITNNVSILEAFKSFVASPPPIEELIFEVKVPPVGHVSKAFDDLSSSTNFQGFIASWQTNALSVYQVYAESSTTNPVLNWFGISRYEHKFWRISPDGAIIVWHNNNDKRFDKKQNPVSSSHWILNYRLAEVLNMGIYSVGIGTIQWNRNHFTAENPEVNLRFRGLLHLDKHNKPSYAELECLAGTNLYSLQTHYLFEHDVGLPYIPSKIKNIRVLEGKEREVTQINIRSIKVSYLPRNETSFLPRTNLLAVPVYYRYYTNDSYFALDQNGKLVAATPFFSGQVSQMSRPYYLLLVGFTSFMIFVFMVRTNTEKNKNKQPLH